MKCDRLNRAIELFYVDTARTHIESFCSGIDDKGWSDYDCNSANKHWSHESRLGPRHRIGAFQNSQQFGHRTEERSKSLPSQFGQKYDNNSASNSKPGILITLHTWGQRMLMHVHVHCMMTAGGVDLKTGQWVDIPQELATT